MDSLTISVVTIMIPGVIMALIYDTYTQHKPWDTFRYILISVVFGVATYILMQCVVFIYQIIIGFKDTKNISWYFLSVWDITRENNVKINPAEILSGGVLSIPFGLLFVLINKKRFFHEFLIRKGISNKYGDDNVYIRSIEKMHENTQCCYVILHENSLTVAGRIYLYNENDKTQEIGLLDATVTNTETGDILFVTNFIYLSKEYGKMMIVESYQEVSNE